MKDPLEELGSHLKRKGLRLTEERKKLVQLILSMKGHFSPEELLKHVKTKRLPISRATIYRILPVLVSAEIIQQSLLTEGQTRFEVTWNKDHHDHLICTYCNKVIEFQHNTIEIMQREIANRYGFILEHHVMELMGRCKDCRN
ncbi:MAG: Fur family transcriptional regulator [Oligoflexia bacterium]|nr:Fur family transcriptional regulator [Oligoflexia bacterium]